MCSQWDSVNGECTFITQALYSVIYYRLILSRLEGVENPLLIRLTIGCEGYIIGLKDRKIRSQLTTS